MDTNLFLEIILSEGALLLNHQSSDGVIIEFYLGINGRRVPILVSDEFTTRATINELLRLLGMRHLIGLI